MNDNNKVLEQAAVTFTVPDHLYDEMSHGYELGYPDGFKAGAQWQKEQTKAMAQNLIGLEAWINDRQMKDTFKKYLSSLLD